MRAAKANVATPHIIANAMVIGGAADGGSTKLGVMPGGGFSAGVVFGSIGESILETAQSLFVIVLHDLF